MRALGLGPYGSVAEYRERLKGAGIEELVKLIKICAILSQTKVYLFYEQSDSTKPEG